MNPTAAAIITATGIQTPIAIFAPVDKPVLLESGVLEPVEEGRGSETVFRIRITGAACIDAAPVLPSWPMTPL